MSSSTIAINTCRSEIIDALLPSIPGAGKLAETFRQAGGGGPFTSSNLNSQLSTVFSSASPSELSKLLRMVRAGDANAWFQIVAKIEYANAAFFARAMVARQAANKLPTYQNFELF